MESRRYELFPNVTDEQWNDWKWQVKNRIETLEDLIVAGVNEAIKKVEAVSAEEMQKITGSMNLPAGMF